MELDLLQDAETEVGSYFVANYPPFSVWNEQHVPAVRELLATTADDAIRATPLGLYLHIPFCRKRCRFCYFRVYTDKNSTDVETYMNALAREIEVYSQQPYLADRDFEFVYFGGGTPSFLSSQQLERLIANISRHWTWEKAREVTFECEPGTLKKSKLETIKQIGVTRLSLGIEHFDDEILEANGRAHKSPEIFRAYEWAREVGFPQINVDLIAGMAGDTDAKWTDTVQKTLALEPDCLTIYQMELPHNTVISREVKEAGAVTPIADWATKRRWVEEAFALFQDAGYEVSSAYTLVKPGPHAGFVYRDALWHGADLVGTGVASFGHLGGLHVQNLDGWGPYVESLEQGALPLSRALPVTDRQLLIREMILQLKTGRIDAGYFREKFGVDILSDFADAYADLESRSYAAIEGDRVTLTSNGLLRVDALLKRFFEPEFQGVRYT